MSQYFNKIKQKVRKNVSVLSFVKIDISFFLLLILALFLEEIKLYFIYVLFIILHELSHFFVAKKLGYLPQKIHFTFFGASLEGYDDFLFSDEIKIIIAGPLFNFLVIVFCYLCFWFNPESYIFLNDILTANLSIFLFNILPIYPLDCGRFILANLSKKHLRNVAVEKVKRLSFLIVFFLFILFLMSFFFEYNFSFGFVCVNLTRLLFKTTEETSYKRQLFVSRKFKILKKGLFERTVYVNEKTRLFELFKFIDDSHYFKFVFIDEFGNVRSKMSEIELYRACEFI